MIENWSSAKVNVYLEEKDKEIDRLHEEVRTLTEQRDDEEARVKVCVKFLRELLHPEYFGWSVNQEVREQARKKEFIDVRSSKLGFDKMYDQQRDMVIKTLEKSIEALKKAA